MPYNEPAPADARTLSTVQLTEAHRLRSRCGWPWVAIARRLGVDRHALVMAHAAAYPHARMSLAPPPAEEDLSDG